MSTYKTKNPLGSAAVKDLYDNAENVDKFVNDRTKEELEDRLGVLRKTWHGMEMIFSRFIDYITGRGEQAVAAIGWQELGNWAVGLAVDNRQQIVYYNGSWYKYLGELEHVIAGDSPENDGGVWSAANPTGKWSNIGDAALRSNLGSGEEGFGDYLVTHRHATGYTASLNTFLNASINYVFPEAFGTEYNEVRLQAAIDYAVARGLRLVATNRTFTINAAITIPTQLNADFTGTIITPGAGITSGPAVIFGGPASVVAGQYAGIIHNLTVQRALVDGHANPASVVDGVSFGSSTGQSSDMTLYNLSVFGFRDSLRFDGPDTYLNHFICPRIGLGWRRGVAVYANVNSNENYGFVGGSVFNINNAEGTGVGVYIDPAASGTDIYFSSGFSIDYCDESIVQYQSTIHLNSCHLENNNNNPHITLSYTGGKEKPVLIMNGGTMGGGPGVVSWTGEPSEPLTPTEQAGGRPWYIYVKFDGQSSVHINGTKCGGYLAGQRRRTQLVKVQYNGAEALNSMVLKPILDAGDTATSSRPMRLCDAINAIMISPYNLNAWTQSYGTGGTTYVFSTDTSVYYDADSPTSRKYVGTDGTNSTGLYQEIPCLPGSLINIHAEVKVPTLTQGYCALRIDFYDFKGNVIGSSIKTVTVVTDWTQVWVYTKVPNGAVKVRVQEYYNAFIGTAYFSNENVWFH